MIACWPNGLLARQLNGQIASWLPSKSKKQETGTCTHPAVLPQRSAGHCYFKGTFFAGCWAPNPPSEPKHDLGPTVYECFMSWHNSRAHAFWLPAAGWRLQAAGYWLLASACWLLPCGCLLAAGSWLLDAGCLLLAAWCCLLAAGCWLLPFACWLLLCWLLAAGCWLVAAGC